MFTSIQEALKELQNESNATQKLFKNLTDDSLSQKVYVEGRTLARLAWHIVTSAVEMMNKTDLKITEVAEDAPIPATANEILEAYKKVSSSLLAQLNEKWTDDCLGEIVNMYGEDWSKNNILVILMKHEIHHRAQMTVLMRQAGLKVPGLYGPAKEEWSQYNMPPME
ncbi:MAG: DinB family protein [Ignavibacteriaceae bacterium]|nr:DinB family protein [Ignavibacteriaceae bacterium]